jgi:glutamate-5-semialdehyde dehydrogenase
MNPSQKIGIETILRKSRKASHEMSLLSDSHKRESLDVLADLIAREEDYLLTENQKDLTNYQNKISESLFQRLILNPAKMQQIIQGIRDVRDQPDPVGKILSRRELDEGLILEKQTVPIGVVGIIFESRPDVLPQILSLALKSGNAVVLKGGHEAYHSNLGFMSIVEQLYRKCAWMPAGWAILLDSREDVHKMLNFPQYIDLIIPRGSKSLVRSIMEATSIPVLGHADGICHLYIDAEADLGNAGSLVVDCKAQYPAACNAIETLLIHRDVAERFMPTLDSAAADAGIHLRGCPETRRFLPDMEAATEKDWHTEYGDKTLSVRIVPDVSEAIIHINYYGSHHTDAILTLNTETQEKFLNGVDSASVFANASTRFADGFRYGLGAELGISTNRTHARGPVGVEGLLSYKFKIRGEGQIVADYVDNDARPFTHRDLDSE